MDIVLIILGFICCVIGLFGSFLPVLPGPFLSWIGLLLLYFTEKIQMNYWVLGISLILVIVISVLDYTIPAKGTKRFGGTKYGIWGTNIGMLIGFFIPIPFGFVIGAFVGAFLGELIYNSQDKNRAFKAATGSFLGFLASSFMKFVVCLCFIFMYLTIVFRNYSL
jgi:uncharacterized protein